MSKCELKPCPFCGGEVNVFENYLNQFGVICDNCEAVMWVGDITNKENVIQKWNERVNV